MKLKHYLRLACASFIKFLKGYFTTFYIINGLIGAIFFSFFIYEAYFGISFKIADTLFGLLGIYLFLKQKKQSNFWMGFFIGIFWFYWIALSFRYYDLSFMIPLIVLLVALVYAILFALFSYFKNPFIRAFFLFLASYIHPFNFSWFKPELIFIDSYLGVSKWQFGVILIALSSFVHIRNQKPATGNRRNVLAFLSLFILLFAVDFSTHQKSSLDLNIQLCDQRVPQDIKWLPRYQNKIIQDNLKLIKKAIQDKKDMIILSESAFPIFLNRDKNLLSILKKLSHKIIIITGALRSSKEGYYNSTYYFIDGKLKIADKVVLVPFGEEIPLPKFLQKWINRVFFDGAEDFKTAKKPATIKIKDKKFTNAICYEATEDIIYKNHSNFIIAISNNAWFTPSIEPTLQHLLLKYYSKVYHTTIIHSANMGISGIIEP